MSEYQYYEFQAVDRPLDDKQLRMLRNLSTRARITPTSFVNHYDWGDFKGDPAALMEQCFDLHLYLANWGTHRFMLRLPRRFLDPRLARRYCAGDAAAVQATAEHVVLDFESRDEEGGDWEVDGDGSGWLSALAPLRSELMQGDLRCLYLGWLLCVRGGCVDGTAREPAVPAGLAKLSGPLAAFAEFMRLDDDLLTVAAEASGDDQSERPRQEVEECVRALPEAEKTALLLRFINGDDPHLAVELRRRFAATSPGDAAGRRTAAELLAAAEALAEERRQRAAKREAKERARRGREQAAARAKYLEELAKREDMAWRQTEALINTKQPRNYERALDLLKDLRDLGVHRDGDDAFAAALRSLRSRHARKPSFLARLDKEGLAA
jgi:FtsZ-interacting cell division protein YlmF